MVGTGWLCFDITRDDVRRHALAMRSRAWKRSGETPAARLLHKLAWGSVAIFGLLGTWLTVHRGDLRWLAELGTDPLLRGLLAALFAVAGFVGLAAVSSPWVAVRLAARRADGLGLRRVRIGDDGVHVDTATSRSVIGWSGIMSVEESGGDVRLFVDESSAVLLPARAFATSNDRHAFVEECRLRVAAERITQTD
jgi:hypothetical protein